MFRALFMWKYKMFLQCQFWHWSLLSISVWPSSQGGPCVFISLERDRWTWSFDSGLILQTWSQQDTTTANFWERQQLRMYTQNSNHVQSHLTQPKWLRFSLIFFYPFLWFGDFSFSCWAFYLKYDIFSFLFWNNRMHILI